MARRYIEGNTVRKKVISYPDKRQERYDEYRRRIMHSRELSYRAREERLRRKRTGMDITYLVMFLAATIITLVLCFTYLQLQTSININIRSIEAKEKQLDRLRSENDSLSNSIDSGIDLSKIYQMATTELGMIYADENQVITFDKTESEYVRQYEDIPE